MLVVSNRAVAVDRLNAAGVADEKLFGETVNQKGPDELRFAYAERRRGRWRVELVPEPDRISRTSPPSKKVFKHLRRRLMRECKNCVFFIHGFNQSFKESLVRAQKIEERYDVEVVVFSWPSNPGGVIIEEYKRAKAAARASVNALDRTFEKMQHYLRTPFKRSELRNCHVSFNLMAYSLGNYLLQKYVENPIFSGETVIFDNVVLTQADVDNQSHAHWVSRVETGKHVFVTINENDHVLKWSDLNFQRDRLGRTARGLNAPDVVYVDFTGGPGVGNTHGFYHEDTNEPIRQLFAEMLNGRPIFAPAGFVYNERKNAFEFPAEHRL